tara:strand:- start:185 stop:427 length:243 start_codon:yes stop_codon:yes gene_type:complete
MADNNIVCIDGEWKKLTDAEFETQFGYTPTSASTGETLFNGRYEHSSWVSGSIASNGLVHPTDQNVKNSGDTLFSISGSI